MVGKVLITRPVQDSSDIATKIQQKGYEVECCPFLKVIFHQVELGDLGCYSGLIFTSGNAVRAFCQNTEDRGLSVWVVGDVTAELARANGFKDVQSAGKDVAALNALLPTDEHIKPLLYVRGEHILQELGRDNIDEVIVYHTEIIKEILQDTLSSISQGEFSDVLFFSKRTAEAFVDVVQALENYEGLKATRGLCLGDSMVNFVSVLPWKSIEVAKHPDKKSIVALLD